ncbi:MAG: 2-amino-4-hydroxy-6-hydroxymethyldihydropteridine diphosphokinase [Bacteroidota bacterium]
MNSAYILTGGNMGNSLENLSRAATAIAKNCGSIIAQSSIYRTAAWGNQEQPDFLNQVLLINTLLEPLVLLKKLLDIEHLMGRVRDKQNDPRTIDLDILCYNDLVLDSTVLTLPHPRLHLRRFVLVPLNEIAPDLEHPVLHKSIKQLLQQCPDTLNVKKFSW